VSCRGRHPQVVGYIYAYLYMVLFCFCSLLAAEAEASQIKYRTAKSSDISSISRLLIETFEGDIPSWNILQRKLAQDGYQKQLSKRMKELVQAGDTQHALIVAIDMDIDRVAGFMELGTMPSPVPIMTTWQGVETTSRPEMPFLANLAVGEDYRRQQMGTKLVQLALKIAEKWSIDIPSIQLENAAVYLAVEKENAAAVSLYDRLDFCRIIDETEKLSKEAQRKLKRKPRLYFERKLFREE
jgi:ribosomal protein S18 acetylase RimI-like enzyme